MRILAVGGGSGGHVTPIVAVLKELKEQGSDAELRVWCDKAFYARTVEAVGVLGDNVRVQKVVSGKVRRFYGVSFWKQMLRLRTLVVPNIIDSFKIAFGAAQSFGRMLVWRPDVVFCKGGFVSVPVGLAARLLRIPIVLHDSDAHPGLANRLLAGWASKIGTGATLDHYNYSSKKAQHVGIPISEDFRIYDQTQMNLMKSQLGFDSQKPLVVVTGGGLGAKPVNDAVVSILERTLAKANVLLISGDFQYKELSQKLANFTDRSNFQLHAFLGADMPVALAAADVVIARAGATTLLELAALGKPTILVPNPNLPGGHQTKNAAPYAEKNAAIVLDEVELESDAQILGSALSDLLNNPQAKADLSLAIQMFARPNAAKDMVTLILAAAAKKGGKDV